MITSMTRAQLVINIIMEFSQDGVYITPGDVIGVTGGNIYDNREDRC